MRCRFTVQCTARVVLVHDYEMQVHCTVYSARRTSTTAVGHATHVRRTSTTLALKGLNNRLSSSLPVDVFIYALF